MTRIAVSWLLLAVALAAIPCVDPARERLTALAQLGRLHRPPERSVSVRRPPGLGELRALSVGTAVGIVVALPAGPALGAASAVVAATSWQLVRDVVRRRARQHREAALLRAIRVIVAELAAGSRPAAALAAAGSTSSAHAEAFEAAAARAARGEEVDDVLSTSGDLLSLAQAWRLSIVTGAPLAGVLGHVADDLAARAHQDRVVASALASARSSAAVLAVLPVLGIGLGSAMDADPLGFLVHDPTGRWVLLGGVVLDAAGVLWTRRMTARAERA